MNNKPTSGRISTGRCHNHFGYVLFAATVTLLFTVSAWATQVPFEPGEKFTYNLRWGFIDVGKATSEVRKITDLDGVPAYHFVMTARSNSFLDAFYKVRDTIEAWTDTAMTRSLLYHKNQHEGRHRRQEVVRFIWQGADAEGVALYHEALGGRKERTDLMPGSLDPLSAFFYVRTQPLHKGAIIKRPITDGKKNVWGRATVVGRETIKIDEQEYDTWVIVPDLEHVGGVFKKSKDATIRIWITADERQMLVKLASKVVVGHFVGELIANPEEESTTTATK
jgi:hypothetical protein